MWESVRLFFHTPGILATSLQPTVVNVAKDQQYDIDVMHEEFKMLDYKGQDCIKSKTFNQDKCTQELFEARLFQEVNIYKSI